MSPTFRRIPEQTTEAEVLARLDRIIGLFDNPTPSLQQALEQDRMTPHETYQKFIEGE